LLVKEAVPVPFDVFGSLIVGFAAVDQQTPFSVTEAPPSLVTLPPETAVVRVIEVAAAVVRVGTTMALVVNVISVPYAVPALLVAKART
jgi:hypothetical protein